MQMTKKTHIADFQSRINISEKDGVLFLPVKVQPKASTDAIVGEHAGALKVKVTAAPEKGKANRAVRELLAEKLGVSNSAVGLVHGESSKNKLFAIRGIRKDDLLKILAV
ncbi:MAG: DUF167 domain-containing protein [Candidatus Aureabacteria bacterium]|nr:DUF167 domain-containing protein [Candidatus Auribacterota bacterium]